MNDGSVAHVRNFYQHRCYQPLWEQRVVRNYDIDQIHFSTLFPNVRSELSTFSETVTFERAGVLKGEFVLLVDAEALVHPSGNYIKLNVSCENHWGDYALNRVLRSKDALDARLNILDMWDRIPSHDNIGILSDAHHKNYFHATLEMIPRTRFLAQHSAAIYVPASYMSLPHVSFVIGSLASEFNYFTSSSAIRVRDPVVAHDQFSSDGVHWLREHAGLRASTGTRRLYVRRGPTARGGGLLETETFKNILKEFDIETIDFGNGDLTVKQQVDLISGAGLIIAPHGANITNIAYLDGPLALVEIMPLISARTMYAELCAILGFSYRCLFAMIEDESNSAVFDCAELRSVLVDLLG